MRWLVTLAGVTLLAAQTLALDAVQKNAQTTTQKQPGLTATAEHDTQKAVPEKLKPTPEMRKLMRLIVGRWQVEQKYEISPSMPQGGEGKGAVMIHRGPGGLSIISNYRSTGPSGNYQAAGIITWSPEENAYKQFWVDNSSPAGKSWQGIWQGEALVLTTKQNLDGQQTFLRQTLSGFSHDGFNIIFDIGKSDADLKPFMSFKFTRMPRESAGAQRHGTGMHGRPNPDSWAPRADASLR